VRRTIEQEACRRGKSITGLHFWEAAEHVVRYAHCPVLWRGLACGNVLAANRLFRSALLPLKPAPPRHGASRRPDDHSCHRSAPGDESYYGEFRHASDDSATNEKALADKAYDACITSRPRRRPARDGSRVSDLERASELPAQLLVWALMQTG